MQRGTGFGSSTNCSLSPGQDSASGFLMESNKQVEKACRAIAEDENLKDGYHAVGLSQGGQFL